MKISIIIPVLNDAGPLSSQLLSLQEVRRQGHEVIVIDGGSSEDLQAVQAGLTDRFEVCGRGRARQMNRGAELATGEVLLFLHADTRLPEGAIWYISQALQDPAVVWGRFDVRLSGGSGIFRVIERAMNLRSQVSGVATGDQCLFVRRDTFRQLGGYPDIPLMEDVALSKRLRRQAWPLRLRHPVLTSSRRWEQHGVLKTVVLMWWLRLLYFCGVKPENLVNKYYR